MGIEFAEDKVAFCGPWIGEFAWEFMTWIPYLRKLSREYGKMIICTYPGMEALYTGFHCALEFNPIIGAPERSDNWEDISDVSYSVPSGAEHIRPFKKYRVDGEYIRYGSPVEDDIVVLFHARGIAKGQHKNWSYEKWQVLAKALPGSVCIGSSNDMNVYRGLDDWMLYQDARWANLVQLVELIASAKVVIGGSSGIMHLALMCGTPVVTWGTCNNFGDTLENRYKETWNPFGTLVTWIGDTWDPEPEQILNALKPKITPDPQTLDLIKRTIESPYHIVVTAYMGKKDGKDALFAQAGGSNFPDEWLERVEKDLAGKVKESISQAKAERMPKSWA